jgi:hypothetical protein
MLAAVEDGSLDVALTTACGCDVQSESVAFVVSEKNYPTLQVTHKEEWLGRVVMRQQSGVSNFCLADLTRRTRVHFCLFAVAFKMVLNF